MLSAAYYSNLQKAAEYEIKANDEKDGLLRRALEAVVREYLRRADEIARQARKQA
jgi:hypothetical protein